MSFHVKFSFRSIFVLKYSTLMYTKCVILCMCFQLQTNDLLASEIFSINIIPVLNPLLTLNFKRFSGSLSLSTDSFTHIWGCEDNTELCNHLVLAHKTLYKFRPLAKPTNLLGKTSSSVYSDWITHVHRGFFCSLGVGNKTRWVTDTLNPLSTFFTSTAYVYLYM